MNARKPSTATRVRRAEVTAIAGFALAAIACAGRAPVDSGDGPRPAWPPPPDPARVEYLQTVRVPHDLGIRRGWFRTLLRQIAGRRVRHGMARPYAVAVSPRGTLAVADPDGRSVHLYDVDRGRYRRLAEADGRPLLSPIGVAFDERERLYVSDSVRRQVLRFDFDGRSAGPLAGQDRLQRPTGLAYDRARGVLYVVDTLAHRVLAFGPGGRVLDSFGEHGAGTGEFNYPVAVALDSSGRVYVADSMNFRVQVFAPDGEFHRAFGKAGRAPGSFDKIKGIALDADDHVYVVEGLHDVVQVFDDRGRLLTVVGGTGSGAGEFVLPAGICIDDRGRIFVADSANRRVQVLRYLPETA